MSLFWRNDSRTTFETDGTGDLQLDQALGLGAANARFPLRMAWESLTSQLATRLQAPRQGQAIATNRWLVQEVSWRAGVLEVRLVFPECDKKILGAVVGGGLACSLEANGHISGEMTAYFHRLVCTNGMIQRVKGAGRFQGDSLEAWQRELGRVLPGVLEGGKVGMDVLERSAQVRLGILRPVLPVALDYLEIGEPYKGLILDAFAVEPGDSLWHFSNAFSRAANLVLLEAGVPRQAAWEARRRLQSASVRLCETMLDQFTQGKSLLEVADALKGDMGADRLEPLD